MIPDGIHLSNEHRLEDMGLMSLEMRFKADLIELYHISRGFEDILDIHQRAQTHDIQRDTGY